MVVQECISGIGIEVYSQYVVGMGYICQYFVDEGEFDGLFRCTVKIRVLQLYPKGSSGVCFYFIPHGVLIKYPSGY